MFDTRSVESPCCACGVEVSHLRAQSRIARRSLISNLKMETSSILNQKTVNLGPFLKTLNRKFLGPARPLVSRDYSAVTVNLTLRFVGRSPDAVNIWIGDSRSVTSVHSGTT